jgi:hypothetical protein
LFHPASLNGAYRNLAFRGRNFGEKRGEGFDEVEEPDWYELAMFLRTWHEYIRPDMMARLLPVPEEEQSRRDTRRELLERGERRHGVDEEVSRSKGW